MAHSHSTSMICALSPAPLRNPGHRWTVTRVADRRRRYGKSHDPPPEAYDAAARWQRITELNQRLTQQLNPETRELWQALEQALHVHWLDVAVAHYSRGHAAGAAQGWVQSRLSDATDLPHKLRAICYALLELADGFEAVAQPRQPQEPSAPTKKKPDGTAH